MEKTETVWVDKLGMPCAPGQGRPVEIYRLDASEHEAMVNDFVRRKLGRDCPDSEFAEYAARCRVVYDDDLVGNTGSWCRVVDGNGDDDGTGIWTLAG